MVHTTIGEYPSPSKCCGCTYVVKHVLQEQKAGSNFVLLLALAEDILILLRFIPTGFVFV